MEEWRERERELRYENWREKRESDRQRERERERETTGVATMALRLNLTKGKRTRIKKNRGGQRLQKWREKLQKEEQSKPQSAAQADTTRRSQPFHKVGKSEQERRRAGMTAWYATRWGMTNEEALVDLADILKYIFSKKMERRA